MDLSALYIAIRPTGAPFINRDIHNNYNIKFHNKRVRKESKNQYKIDQKVLIYFPQIPTNRNRKFYSKWKGPYKILELNGLNCKVQNCMKDDDIIDVHLSRVKPYFDPIDVKLDEDQNINQRLTQNNGKKDDQIDCKTNYQDNNEIKEQEKVKKNKEVEETEDNNLYNSSLSDIEDDTDIKTKLCVEQCEDSNSAPNKIMYEKSIT